MKLTRRQEEFIENLIDLSHELDGPIHYSMLAERLGVSPFTAYDMLRLLEEKGVVTSEYQIAEGKSGPGRAERLFCPVLTHEQRLAGKFGAIPPGEEELKQFVMNQVRGGQIPKEQGFDELLSRVAPDGPEHIRYCLEVMMVIALRLRQHAGQQKFLTYFSDILPAGDEVSAANLSLLGGFAFGILAQEETKDQQWSLMLLEHGLQYQEIVRNLAANERRLLADELKMVFSRIPASLESAASPEPTAQPEPTAVSI
jgi:DNA-binding Lrp family transcriptional regulator